MVAVLSAAYIAAQILSDVTSLKIISIAGRSVDAGTLVYPFTFTLRDLVHKVAGRQVARALIFTAAVVNLAMAALFWLVDAIPGSPDVGPQLAFGDVLAPVWRIVIASIVAEVVSELVDTEVYSAWVARFGRIRQWGRVLASNGVAIPIDSGLFVVLAFAGTVTGGVLWDIFWLNVLIKGTVTVVSIPWIYLVKPAPALALAE